ncbi:MAG: hypothetical protein ACOYL6_08700 [Bacteriovoracaceae bacterium]
MKISLFLLTFALLACNNMKETSTKSGTSSSMNTNAQSTNTWDNSETNNPVNISIKATIPARVTENSIIPYMTLTRVLSKNGKSCTLEVKQDVEMKIVKIDEDRIKIVHEDQSLNYERISQDEWETVIRNDSVAEIIATLVINKNSISIEMNCRYK